MLSQMVHGQRLRVLSLVEAKQGRRVIHAGQVVCIYKTIADSYALGKESYGEFKQVLAGAIEGVHFELIEGEVPYPEMQPLPPFNLDWFQ